MWSWICLFKSGKKKLFCFRNSIPLSLNYFLLCFLSKTFVRYAFALALELRNGVELSNDIAFSWPSHRKWHWKTEVFRLMYSLIIKFGNTLSIVVSAETIFGPLSTDRHNFYDPPTLWRSNWRITANHKPHIFEITSAALALFDCTMQYLTEILPLLYITTTRATSFQRALSPASFNAS